MIKVKHLVEPSEGDDGPRVWLEPIGLTKDVRERFSVDEVLPMLGPPRPLWEWYVEHPDGYEDFRGRYHKWLSSSPHREYLEQLACMARLATFTLLHAGDTPDRNCATALNDFLKEIEAHFRKTTEQRRPRRSARRELQSTQSGRGRERKSP